MSKSVIPENSSATRRVKSIFLSKGDGSCSFLHSWKVQEIRKLGVEDTKGRDLVTRRVEGATEARRKTSYEVLCVIIIFRVTAVVTREVQIQLTMRDALRGLPYVISG